MPFAFRILDSVILRRKNTRRRDRTENQKIENENELIDDGNARHGFRTELSDHDVIKQADEIGDAHLYHPRNGNHQNFFIKSAVADKFLEKCHEIDPFLALDFEICSDK